MTKGNRHWRPFAGSAIGSGSDSFARASRRLAAATFALAAVLVIGFSAILYFAMAQNIQNNVEGEFESDAAQMRFVSSTLAGLRIEIVVLDAGVLVLVGGLAYAFARRTLRPVQRNVEAQRRFVSNASHELRTPLSIMRTEFQVARRGDISAVDVPRLLDEGLDEIRRMTTIVEDLLTLSRIDAQQENLVFAPMDVSALVGRTVDRMRIYGLNYDVSVDFSSTESAVVLADSDHLERAILNLIKNAIEHSPSGTSVRIEVASEGDAVEVRVQDTGEGISAKDMPHIFERFYRAQASEFRERGGSGLGLSVARWVIEAHRGTITVRSTGGTGTEVVVELPRIPASS